MKHGPKFLLVFAIVAAPLQAQSADVSVPAAKQLVVQRRGVAREHHLAGQGLEHAQQLAMVALLAIPVTAALHSLVTFAAAVVAARALARVARAPVVMLVGHPVGGVLVTAEAVVRAMTGRRGMTPGAGHRVRAIEHEERVAGEGGGPPGAERMARAAVPGAAMQ